MAAGGTDLQLAGIQLRLCQPDPAGSEQRFTRIDKPLLELLEAAEIPVDCCGECASGCASTVSCRGHSPPEQTVIHVSTRIVSNDRAKFARHLAWIENQP